MGKYVYMQTDFSAGEVSPRFESRMDTVQFAKSAKKIENMILLPTGGLTKRPGTRFLTEITGQTDPFFIEFPISTTEGYVVSIDPDGTNAFIQIFRDASVSLSAITMNAGAITVTGDVPVAPTALSNTGWHWVQARNRLFIVHNSGTYPPIILQRTAVDTFTQGTVPDFTSAFQTDIDDIGIRSVGLMVPYLDTNIDPDKLLRLSATSGSGVTLFAEDSGATPISLFTANHVGAIFKLTIAASTGFFRVTAFVSASEVTGDILVLNGADMGGLGPTDFWEESAWSNERGWPRSVTSFEQRIYYGGSTFQPDTVWGSFVGNAFHFMQNRLAQDSASDVSGVIFFGSATELDPFNFIPAARRENVIRYLASGRELNIGTFGAEYIASGGAEILSRQSIQIKLQTSHGSSPIMPVQINQALYFVSRDGRRIMEFEFDFDSNSYRTRNLNLTADHIYRHQFTEISAFVNLAAIQQIIYQESRNVLWVLTKRGALVGLTLNKDAEVIGWHTHSFGGTGGTNEGFSSVTGMCVLPGQTGEADDLYVCAKRTVDGSLVYYLERIGVDFEHLSYFNERLTLEDVPLFTDSTIIYSGVSTNTITGLTHLEGETVRAVGNTDIFGEFIVTGGQIVLPYAVTFVTVGLFYRPKLYLQSVRAGGDFGTQVGNITRVDRITVKFYKTYAAKFGFFRPDPLKSFVSPIVQEEFFEDINFMPPGAFLDQIILFTGEKRLHITTDPELENVIIFTQDDPLPLTILGVAMRGVAYD